MAKPKNTDGAIEDLGVLITASYGLDTSWMERGSCYGWGNTRPGHPTPWQVTPQEKVGDIRGSEMVRYALLLCGSCPSQYDCTSYAVQGMMLAGTWGVRVGVLHWLQGEEDALDLIEMARELHAPVQEIASQVMAERSADA